MISNIIINILICLLRSLDEQNWEKSYGKLELFKTKSNAPPKVNTLEAAIERNGQIIKVIILAVMFLFSAIVNQNNCG